MFSTAEGRIQERDGGPERPDEPDAGPGLPAHGPDVAPGTQQDGLHPHCLRRAAGHHVRVAPPAGCQVQPGPGEHAAGRRLPAVREGTVLAGAARRSAPCPALHNVALSVYLEGSP